ncbi:MAG: hypothetical protein ACI4JB_08305 [Porcipelethomonas sp.]
MRITNNYMTRNYLGNLNNSLELYNQSGNRLTTGRKFSKMSENVSDGTRALNIRTQVYKNEQIQENVKKAGESLTVAESNLTSIKDILTNVYAETIEALNSPKASEADIFACDFDAIKNQIVEFANCKYNNSYILGGTNNTSAPFAIENGELTYNGVKVNDIQEIDGKFFSGTTEVPYSSSIYIDVGINMSIKNGQVDPRTAFDMSVSGLDCLGFGTSQITYQCTDGSTQTIEAPNNAYELIDEMAECLRNEDFDKLSGLNDHLKKTLDGLITEISDIGIRTNYLDRHTTRLEDEEYVLTEIQNDVEYIQETDELINNKSMEYSWLLTLQYGSKVLPQSLMNYVQ